MSAHRTERLASLLQEELAKLIVKEVDIAPGVIATISSINISANSEYADIGISVFPEKAGDDAINDFKKIAGTLHHKLIRILNIRTVPRLQFFLDHGAENAAAIEKVVVENPGEFVPASADLPKVDEKEI